MPTDLIYRLAARASAESEFRYGWDGLIGWSWTDKGYDVGNWYDIRTVNLLLTDPSDGTELGIQLLDSPSSKIHEAVLELDDPVSKLFNLARLSPILQDVGPQPFHVIPNVLGFFSERRELDQTAHLVHRRRELREGWPIDLGDHLVPPFVGSHDEQRNIQVGLHRDQVG